MSAPGVGGAHDEGFAPGNVSRSGRVRKKNSLLAGYESLDALEKPKRKSEKSPKIKEKSNASPKVTLKIGGETPRRTPKKPPVKRVKMDTPQTKRNDGNRMDMKARIAAMNMIDDDDDDEGELEIDLPPEFEEEIPLIAAEEIIDETLLDEEDGATEIAEHTSINRLKSQAESTYMMEKSLEKIRKNTNQSNSVPGKAKNARKDKGNPRITAYMLWAKDQRATFAKKYPNLDFSAVSKKLGELWATVPQNQKKMWKNRAAKLMRKNAHVMENMKNSGVSPGTANNVKTTSKKMSAPPKAKFIKTTGKEPVRNEASPNTPKSTGKAKGGGGGSGGKKVNAASVKGSKVENGNRNRKRVSPPSKGGARGGKSKSALATGSSSGISFSSEFTHQTTVHIKNEKKSQSKSLSNHTSISSLNTVNVSTIQAVTSRSSPGSPSSKTQYSPRKDDDVALYKVTGTSPIDVGAHFSLLGESLSIIGERLKDVEGQTVSGSLSVLLDSLLCATGPLLCLTQQVPELNSIPPDELAQLLDNIAYVMPDLSILKVSGSNSTAKFLLSKSQ